MQLTQAVSFWGYLLMKEVIKFLADSKSNTPLGNLIAKEAPEKNQEEKDEEEAKKQRDASWKKMKLTLLLFGVSFGLTGGYVVFVLGAPEKDIDGKPIKDDLSDLPLVKQYLFRAYRELDYYRRVKQFLIAKSFQ